MTHSETTHSSEDAQNPLDSSDSRLIQLDAESKAVGHAQDINNKIDMLDGSLGALNAELESIRASVEQGLDRLSDSDMDLTAKVSDTYKRLGELDNTYKALTEISANIDQEIRKLTGEISQVASQSSAELEKLEATAEVHNSYLTRQQEALAQRVDKLVEDSHATSAKLQLSIRDVQENILLAEQKLIAEIDSLANTSQQQDEILAKNIDAANEEIETSKARIIKLQKVDEALDKRAQQLEQTTDALSQRADDMQSSITALDETSDELTRAVHKLQQHTEALQRESDHHTSLIAAMQKNITQVAQNLFDLGGVERRHFRITSVALLLLVMALVGFTLYQHNTNQTLSDNVVAQSQSLNTQIGAVDASLGDFSQQVKQELQALNEKLTEEVAGLNDKLVSVNSKVEQLDEQAQSLDGRLSAASMGEDFGGDNILHNANWIAKLPPSQYTIQVATVSDKKQLFEIAQRYGDYLKQPVAYYTNSRGQHVMLYGQFDSDRIALNAAQNLPYTMNWQRPVVLSVGSVQQAL